MTPSSSAAKNGGRGGGGGGEKVLGWRVLGVGGVNSGDNEVVRVS